jgi:hypothetical protein
LSKPPRFSLSHGHRDAYLREFLDEFYSKDDKNLRASMLAEDTPLTDSQKANASYAAVAEHLAFTHGLPAPKWTFSPESLPGSAFFPVRLAIPEGDPSSRKPDSISSSDDFCRRRTSLSSQESYASLLGVNRMPAWRC